MPLRVQVCIYFKTNKSVEQHPLKKKKKLKIDSLLFGSLQVWSRQFDFSRQVSGQISILNDDNREQALRTAAQRPQPQRAGIPHLDAAVQISLSGWRVFCFHEAENGDACGCRDRTTTVKKKKTPQELPGCETVFTFSFLLRARRHLHLVPAGNNKGRERCACTRASRMEAHALVVWEGSVWSADGDGEQQHVFGVRLARQGGEQILRFLWWHKWVLIGWKRNVGLNDCQFQEASPPLLLDCPGPPRLPERDRWMWGWLKVTEFYSVRRVLPSPLALRRLLPLLSVPSLPSLPSPLGSSLWSPPDEVSGLVSEGGRVFWRVLLSPCPSFPFSPSPFHPWWDQQTKERNNSTCHFSAEPERQFCSSSPPAAASSALCPPHPGLCTSPWFSSACSDEMKKTDWRIGSCQIQNKASGLWLGTWWPSYRSQNLLLPSVLSSAAAGSPLLQLWTPGCSLIH